MTKQQTFTDAVSPLTISKEVTFYCKLRGTTLPAFRQQFAVSAIKSRIEPIYEEGHPEFIKITVQGHNAKKAQDFLAAATRSLVAFSQDLGVLIRFADAPSYATGQPFYPTRERRKTYEKHAALA